MTHGWPRSVSRVPTFALVTPAAHLRRVNLDEDETHDGALIVRDGQPVRLVVGRLESEDPDELTVLVVTRYSL